LYEEGKARIKYVDGAFLNPKAAISREISVAFVKSVAKGTSRVLDTTAATGIRGIRYCLEDGIRDLTLLEINANAYKALKRNLAFNGVKAAALNKSVQEFANTCDGNFDVIDLDPFGGVAPYIYDLMKISRDGTHLIATATDTAVLCGANSKACMRIYGARPMHNELCHEAGLRILIGYIVRMAAQFNFGIEVLMSVSRIHYMHVFLRLRHGSLKAMDSISNMGYAYYCSRCCFRTHEKAFIATRRTCPECNSELGAFGAMWLGSLYDRKTTRAVRAGLGSGAEKGAVALMDCIKGELDTPFYYDLPKLTQNMHMSSVSPVKVREALERAGFESSPTHMDPDAIRTNADLGTVKRVIDSVMRANHI
jgi:tRNA (guanine26-N2/guanine27-N2)-dimethyltransferase